MVTSSPRTKRDDPGLLLRLGLWMLPGISSRSIQRLSSTYGGFAAASARGKADWAKAMDLRPAGARHLLEAPDDLLGWARGAWTRLDGRGARPVFLGDEGGPDFGPLKDPPEVLFVRGELGGAGVPGAGAVAVVGARRAHPAALLRAHRVGFALAREGRTVVSGGAFGVDASAHRGALDAEGHTVAVLGSGVLVPLPMRNRRLFAEILAAGGALASELPPEVRPRPSFFPRRNRLVAALARAVVVIVASETSGSLYTARAALEMGRPVYVFTDELAGNGGARVLEKEGAIPVASEGELLAALGARAGKVAGMEAPAGKVGAGGAPHDALGRRILEVLDGPPASVLELSLLLGGAPSDVAGALGRLCAAGWVRPARAGRFARARGCDTGAEGPPGGGVTA